MSARSLLLAAGFAVLVLGALANIAEFVESRRAEDRSRVELTTPSDRVLRTDVQAGPPEFIELPSGAAIPVLMTYTVQAGDVLYEIARNQSTTTQVLIDLNTIPDPTRIEVGQVLVLPSSVQGQ